MRVRVRLRVGLRVRVRLRVGGQQARRWLRTGLELQGVT